MTLNPQPATRNPQPSTGKLVPEGDVRAAGALVEVEVYLRVVELGGLGGAWVAREVSLQVAHCIYIV